MRRHFDCIEKEAPPRPTREMKTRATNPSTAEPIAPAPPANRRTRISKGKMVLCVVLGIAALYAVPDRAYIVFGKLLDKVPNGSTHLDTGADQAPEPKKTGGPNATENFPLPETPGKTNPVPKLPAKKMPKPPPGPGSNGQAPGAAKPTPGGKEKEGKGGKQPEPRKNRKQNPNETLSVTNR